MTVAVIYVPAGPFDLHAVACLEYCERKGYEVAGVVHGNWGAVINMLCARLAGVVVVASAEHLPGDREPRIEIVDQPPQQQRGVAQRRRRPNQV